MDCVLIGLNHFSHVAWGKSAVYSTDFFDLKQKNQNSASLAICYGNPPVPGGFPSQKASNAESYSVMHCLICQGEARILKHMKTGQIDMTARRKETQQRKQQQNPFVQSRKLVDFIAQESKNASWNWAKWTAWLMHFNINVST